MHKKLKKVVIIGPESTGKSTLSAALSQQYGEPWVPEYARQYLEEMDREYVYEDLRQIAKGQLALEDQKASEARELVFCDTDLRVIHVWSEHKYGHTDPWVLDQIGKRKYDLYLLTDIDIPWEDDPQREYPDPGMRSYFYAWYERLVQNSGVPVVKISGTLEQRMAAAMAGIATL